MRLDNYIKKLDPKNEKENNLLKFLNSYQFKISQDILGMRIRKGLSEEDAAELVGLNLKSYLKIEQAEDFNSSKEKYLNVLNDLKRSNKYRLKLSKSHFSKKALIKSPARRKAKSNLYETKVQWIYN